MRQREPHAGVGRTLRRFTQAVLHLPSDGLRLRKRRAGCRSGRSRWLQRRRLLFGHGQDDGRDDDESKKAEGCRSEEHTSGLQ